MNNIGNKRFDAVLKECSIGETDKKEGINDNSTNHSTIEYASSKEDLIDLNKDKDSKFLSDKSSCRINSYVADIVHDNKSDATEYSVIGIDKE